MSDQAIINEVGLRDGLQNQPVTVDTDTKAQLARLLVDAGMRYLEPVSFVSPKAIPQMADAAALTPLLPHDEGLHYTALVPNLKGYQLARDAGYPTVALVLSTTDTFNQRNLNMSLEQAAQSCEAIIAAAKEDGIATRTYIAGSFACPYDGPMPVTLPQKLAARMFAAGSDEVAIADTIGAGNPQQMKDIMAPLIREFGAEKFYVHLHDTRGLAAAMAWAAADLGVRRFDASVGGLGGCPFAPGATGNMATEDLVYLLESAGLKTGIDVEKLRAAVALAQQATQRPLGGRILSWMESQENQGKTPCLW
ncbi:MAG: hydroxymethylglutaryl-CoA lyase [Alcanivoracaceae bacterium]|uniref:hydroxymethylglutaryl-CoA lyase n=1 Tax=Alcanivorax TaxID=59753 RepID=UPI000C4B80D1|nr:hydroxymethylglutaryl-CoA lyase [Alcanivorax sp. MD8A]MAX56399.1 hydroxymethylglutaryl-CoA lyase [Alcanivoracaceae bacterium]MED5432946.1 hydroxymethylglutaryl-CoA lyase [Pseudomonadota bacterium]MEE2869993.1 hydroxymethylglutaryl-CoA lyase [Pseudomonadota bacterium]PNE04038.1 hydroxymethylglutaryl-CoA lyase [Alcanivorax sp. MD8A]|tara:strand:+ start:1675 stop:2598 length:924 start_codon:yes stop_codon:yes gene_type:complete